MPLNLRERLSLLIISSTEKKIYALSSSVNRNLSIYGSIIYSYPLKATGKIRFYQKFSVAWLHDLQTSNMPVQKASYTSKCITFIWYASSLLALSLFNIKKWLLCIHKCNWQISCDALKPCRKMLHSTLFTSLMTKY